MAVCQQGVNSPGGDAERQQTTTSVDDGDSKVTSFYHEEQDPRVPSQSKQVEIQATSCGEQEQKQDIQEDVAQLLPADDDGEADKQNSSPVEVVAGFHGMQTQQSVTVEVSKHQTVDQLHQRYEPDEDVKGGKENCKKEAAVTGKDQEQRAEDVEQEERDFRDDLKMGAPEDGDDKKSGEDAKEKATVEEFQKEDMERKAEQGQSGDRFEEENDK